MKLPERIKKVPPYLYAEMDRMIMNVQQKGMEIINLAHGDPDLPPAEPIINTLKEYASDSENHRYPSYWGINALREKIAKWFKRRFEVTLDPEKEIMVLIGAKEGIAHISWALVEKGSYALVPDPSYPTYAGTVIFAGGIPYHLPLVPEKEFKPDLNSIPEEILEKTNLLFLNYPNNPTAATCELEFFKEVVNFAIKYDISVIHDNAYSEIYDDKPPPSILQVEGSKKCALELHSFSKTYSMPGWRLGWVAGNRKLLRALATIKTNVDSGVFLPIQYAGIKALEIYDEVIREIRETYRKRREIVLHTLQEAKIFYYPSKASLYIWLPLPDYFKNSQNFVTQLIKKTGVIVGPGIGYGEKGEGHIRISITQPEDKIKRGMELFKDYFIKNV